ncbi:MAG: PQQ-binding-like beta-propeller repeat protein [Planctomycetes bacterium]|nr:PQQ-binding-like beta-propeller repeat protein [Planctomycetota bacterium]
MSTADGRRRARRQTALGAAVVALLFSLFVTVELALTWQAMHASRGIDHPTLVALRADLANEPRSAPIKAEIRRVELVLRERYLTSERRLRHGAWLLLAGVAVFVLSTEVLRSTTERVPVLVARAHGYDPDRRRSAAGRLAIAAVTLCLIAAAVMIPVPGRGGADVEAARGVWPRFRGAGGLGISPYDNVPLSFDARAGQERNLRWKTVVPLPGMSSPAVWNDRVFVTGAIETTREVYCLDARSGAILWRRAVSAGPESNEVPASVYSETGYAAPTPVTDGAQVFALFANGDAVCFDAFGKQLWCRNLGLPDNMYGLAASPVLSGERLIVQLDQEAGSALIALDRRDGTDVWRTARDVGSSWPTPIPIETAGGPQIVTCANPFTIAYDPATGRELWRVDSLAGDGGPSPTFGEGLVFAVNVGSPLVAIRPDGRGDVTDSHVAWRWRDGQPDVCSPLCARGLVWLVASDGWTTCLDARTGAKMWHQALEVSFYSSPSLAGDRVYLIGRQGELFVIAAEREFRQLATGHLGEECDTSPAFADGRIYVRGRRHLFCFEEPGS